MSPSEQSYALLSLPQIILASSSMPGRFGMEGETYYWTTSCHLHIRLYEKLVYCLFDIVGDGQLIEEIEELMKLLKFTWPYYHNADTILIGIMGCFHKRGKIHHLQMTKWRGALGDNDPVDVVEIGESRAKIGQVLKVKPLSALAMVDEGELDWKIVAISLDDPKASLVNDVEDVEKHFPGTLTAIRDWFRDYKIPDGKPPNKFGLGNKPANKDYALKVITETHESWAKLVERVIPSGDLLLA